VVGSAVAMACWKGEEMIRSGADVMESASAVLVAGIFSQRY
jgi:hypothetical protein